MYKLVSGGFYAMRGIEMVLSTNVRLTFFCVTSLKPRKHRTGEKRCDT